MNILTVFGTRPEAIKLAPVISQLKKQGNNHVHVCTTGQHRQMLDQVLNIFDINPDYDLNIMQENQTLTEITYSVLQKLDEVFSQHKPDFILVQGDTTTTFIAALTAFYHKIRVGHVEAGLRSGDMLAPWPEEMNRKLTSPLATIHFAPTRNSADNLLKEGIREKDIFVTGNTVIDALFYTTGLLKSDPLLLEQYKKQFSFLNEKKKLILVTGHRRESFGKGFEEICKALAAISQREDVEIIYPVHLNPNVSKPVNAHLSQHKNIFLIPPQDYLAMVYLMQACYIVLTDSGGIQEEAPSLGKPVIVMRETTERPEGILAGNAKLAGVSSQNIIDEVTLILEDSSAYEKMSFQNNPYGDGHASERIAQILEQQNY
jgi:UDP-N-acetylglucosamine 2-epimerase (non-hydrolysing)